MVYLHWLKSKVKVWQLKANRIIEEVQETILQTYPRAVVSVTGSYYTKCFVPWSNFNFSVSAVDSHGSKIKPEEMMDCLVTEFSRKSDMLNQIKYGTINHRTYRGQQLTMLSLECKEEFDKRKIEINLREDKTPYRIENIIQAYMKTYKFLEPLYYVLKKFLHNTELCNLSESVKNQGERDVDEILMLAWSWIVYADIDDCGIVSKYEISAEDT